MTLLVRGFLFGLGFALASCSDNEPEPPAEEPASELTAELQRRVDAAVDAGFSGAILVRAGAERLLAGGYGLADRERSLDNTEDTAFDVGSILKNFTATAIFKLAESGVLTLSEPLGELFPDVPPDKANITLLQIVQHSAGFDEYHDTTGDFEAMTEPEARARILAQELLFPPGTDVAYSNSGYTLLASVVEQRAGATFTDYVHQSLLEPAGSRQSGFYSEPLWNDVDTAIGYDAESFGDNDPASWPYTWALVGNGGLVTTVGDLDRWISALFGGKIVDPDTLELMRGEYFSAGEGTLAGETAYGEAGAGDYGFGGVLIYVPGEDVRVIIATNTYESFDIETFAVELAELVLGEP